FRSPACGGDGAIVAPQWLRSALQYDRGGRRATEIATGDKGMTGALRLLLLALLGATLVACSSLSYRAADVWLRWNLNGLVSLDGAQERALEQRLDQLLNWHRREQLPRYRQWLEEARAELAEPALPAARWRARSEELRLFWVDAMARLQSD